MKYNSYINVGGLVIARDSQEVERGQTFIIEQTYQLKALISHLVLVKEGITETEAKEMAQDKDTFLIGEKKSREPIYAPDLMSEEEISKL